MKLIVDGECRDWVFDPGRTLEDVVIDTNQRLIADESRIVTGIKLDEYEEGLNTDLTWDKVSIDKIKQVSIETEPVIQYLDSHLEAGQTYLEECRDSVSTIVGDVLSGDVNAAMDALKETIEKLMWFFNLMTQIGNAGVLNIDEIMLKDESFKDFVVRFNTTLKEIAEAMFTKNTTLINDFLEYELEPAIGVLIDMIPGLRETISKNVSDAKG